MIIAATNWFLFIGRFHPVLVHLPIGMMVLLAILEIAGIKAAYRDPVGKIRTVIVPVLTFCALVTAACGWLLATGGDYNPELLFWHRWLGVSVAALCVIMLIETRRNWLKSYFVTLAVALITVAITGHLGGSMTYGSGYLTRYAPGPIKRLLGIETASTPAPLPKISHISTAFVYPQIIQAIFTQNCISCHGQNRQKGGLRLDSYHRVMSGARGTRIVLPGQAARSVLIQRIALPVGKSHRMPPRGHRPLSAGEIAILNWWVQAGAPNRVLLMKAHCPPDIMADIRKLFSQTQSTTPRPRNQIAELISKISQHTGMQITFLNPKSAMLRCSAATDARFSDHDLAALEPIVLNIESLNLDGTAVSDNGIGIINRMVNLQSLHLKGTRMDAQSVLALNHLSHLRYLSIPNHHISNADIRQFKKQNFVPHLVVNGDSGLGNLPSF